MTFNTPGRWLWVAVCLFFLSSPVAGAAQSAPPADVPCAEQVAARLEAWQARGRGLPQPHMLGEQSRHTYPTSTIGVWVLLRVSEVATLERIDRRATHAVTWTGADCGPVEHTRPTAAFAEGQPNDLTDEELGRLIDAERRVVIVVWSPHEPLSVEAVRHVEGAGRAAGARVVAVMHPRADFAFAREVARTAGLPADAVRPARSIELLFRGALQQAPAVVAFSNGQSSGQARPGYLDARGYEAWLRQQFGDATSDDPTIASTTSRPRVP